MPMTLPSRRAPTVSPASSGCDRGHGVLVREQHVGADTDTATRRHTERNTDTDAKSQSEPLPVVVQPA